MGDRHQGHEMCKHVIAKYGRQAGLRVAEEPATSTLLRGHRAWGAFEDACKVDGIRAKDLRIDLLVSDDVSGREWEIDTTVPSTTAQLHIAKDLRAIKAKGDVGLLECSVAVVHAEQAKHDKYEPLLKAQRREVRSGARAVCPTFIAAVVSHAGHVGSDFVKLIEIITAVFKRNNTEQCRIGRLDGKSLDQLTAEFRHAFRTDVQVAVALRAARMFDSAGLRKEYCKKFALRT